MADQPREFRINGPLPLLNTEEKQQTQAVRLCVFMNMLQTMYYLIDASERQASPTRFDALVHAGHNLAAMLLLIGILKEGGDAVRDFSSQIDDILRRLTKEGKIDAKPLSEAWDRVKAAIDKNNPDSFWNRHLKHVRDRAGFHWSRDDITNVCSSEGGTNAPYLVLRENGNAFTSVRFTLADEVIGRVAFPVSKIEEGGIQKIVVETKAFAADIIVVIGTTVPAYFREHGCAIQPFEGV